MKDGISYFRTVSFLKKKDLHFFFLKKKILFNIKLINKLDLVYFGVALASYYYALKVKKDFGKGLKEASK